MSAPLSTKVTRLLLLHLDLSEVPYLYFQEEKKKKTGLNQIKLGLNHAFKL